MQKRFIWFFLAVLIGLSGALLIGMLLNGPYRLSKFPINPVDAAKTREPLRVLFLSPSRSAELWRSAVDGSQPKMLTHTAGKVLSFDVARDGSRIVFSMENSQMGADVAVVGSNGESYQVLVRCGEDQCELPVWSVDGRQIAFTRLAAQPAPGEAAGLSRPWLVDVSTGQTHPLDNDPLITATQLSWSPDGKQLAFFDPTEKGIRVRNLSSRKEVLIGTNVQGVGSWSPDGQQMIFNQEEDTGGFTFMKVYRIDFTTGKSVLLLGSDPFDASDYSIPAWSPDGQWLVFGQRRLAGSSSKQLWLIQPDGAGSKAITQDLSATFAAYRWSPDSTAIVFQSFRFGSSENVPEVYVWHRDTGKILSILQDAVSPQWLP